MYGRLHVCIATCNEMTVTAAGELQCDLCQVIPMKPSTEAVQGGPPPHVGSQQSPQAASPGELAELGWTCHGTTYRMTTLPLHYMPSQLLPHLSSERAKMCCSITTPA